MPQSAGCSRQWAEPDGLRLAIDHQAGLCLIHFAAKWRRKFRLSKFSTIWYHQLNESMHNWKKEGLAIVLGVKEVSPTPTGA